MQHNAFEHASENLGTGVIISGDRQVVNIAGENYYRACGYPVHGAERCIKREGHFSAVHESMDGSLVEAQ